MELLRPILELGVVIPGMLLAYYYNIFGQESRAASPAFPPSRA